MTTARVSVDLPKVDARIIANVSWSLNGSLGCHSVNIQGVYGTLSFRESTSLKDGSPVFKTDSWGKFASKSSTGVTKEEFYKAFLEDDKAQSDVYSSVVAGSDIRDIVLLSTTLNYGARAREGSTREYISTLGFANWLIKNKIGHVTSSPVAQNTNHRGNSSYSMVQAWIWIPPKAGLRAIKGTSGIHGEDNLVDWKQFYKQAKVDGCSGTEAWLWPNGKYVPVGELYGNQAVIV